MQSRMKELAGKSVLSFIANITGGLLAIVLSILSGRFLGADLYGEVTYVITFLAFFTVLAKLGFENGLVYYLSSDQIQKQTKRGILTFCICVAFGMGILLIGAGYLFRGFIYRNLLNGSQYAELLCALLPTVLLDSIAAILRSALRGERRIKESVVAEYFIIPINKVLGLIVIAGLLGIRNYYSLVIPYYIGDVCAIAYNLYCLKKSNMVGRIEKGFSYGKVLAFSFPVLLSGFLAVINNNVDKYMIGYLRDSASVAIYDNALQMGSASSVALTAVNSIFAPMISNLYHRGEKKELKNLYAKSTKWITVINFLVFGVMVLFSKEIMQLPGQAFVKGKDALCLIAFGQIVNAVVGSVGYLNIMTGHPKMELMSSVTAVFLNILLNAAFIPSYGMTGAAAASAVSLAVRNLMNFMFLYKNMKIHPYNWKYLGIFLALILGGIPAFLLSKFLNIQFIMKLIIGGAVYSIIYMLVIWRFAMDKEETDGIKRLLAQVKLRRQ